MPYSLLRIEAEDSSAPAAPNAADVSATVPTDSATTSDDATSADVSTDAADASTMGPTDPSSAADVPMAVPFYGAAVGPDE